MKTYHHLMSLQLASAWVWMTLAQLHSGQVWLLCRDNTNTGWEPVPSPQQKPLSRFHLCIVHGKVLPALTAGKVTSNFVWHIFKWTQRCEKSKKREHGKERQNIKPEPHIISNTFGSLHTTVSVWWLKDNVLLHSRRECFCLHLTSFTPWNVFYLS